MGLVTCGRDPILFKRTAADEAGFGLVGLLVSLGLIGLLAGTTVVGIGASSGGGTAPLPR